MDPVAVAAAFLAVSYIAPIFWVPNSRNTDVMEGKLLERNGRSPTQ